MFPVSLIMEITLSEIKIFFNLKVIDWWEQVGAWDTVCLVVMGFKQMASQLSISDSDTEF